MAKTKISEFSSTPANNTDIDSINIAEGCAPSGINDAIRELMAQLKDFQTGAQGDSFNGPIGTSTAAAGAFTTLSATGAITSTLATGTAPLVIASTTKVANLNVDLLDGADWASPAALGSTNPAAVSATTLSASSTVTLSGGTANGVAYLNGSKVVTSGSALTFDGTNLGIGGTGQLRFATSGGSLGDNWIQTTNSYDLTLYCGRGSTTQMNLSLDYFKFAIGGTEGMRLTSTGLGIGTSSPSYKLDVNGSARINNLLWFTPSSGGMALGANGTNFEIYNGAGTETRLTLNNSGNLGLGVTPSGWFSGTKAIQLVGSAYTSTASTAYLYQNGYLDSSTVERYYANGYASKATLNSGGHQWYTAASGTAGNAITFTQAMTLTANGELMVGTTTATGKASIAGAITATASSALVNPSVGVFGLYTGGAIPNTYVQMPSGGSIDFWKADTGVAARIDSSGNWIVGKTSANDTTGGLCYFGASKYLSLVRDNSAPLFINRLSTDGAVVEFARSTTLVGTISVTTTATAYNTSSDYRLKNTIAPMTGALAKVAQLKPCTYKWNVDGSDGQGFIAHELAEVVPQCVTGEKDAVDEEGNPKYQGIDTSFLVATLTAAIQEQQAIINSLKARLDAANL